MAYTSLCLDDEFDGDYWDREPTIMPTFSSHVAINTDDQEDDWMSDSELCAPVEMLPQGENNA